ncbi:MAG: phosphoribosylformylglycinamidine synthase subunit PurQ [Pseudomonadota bacterium]
MTSKAVKILVLAGFGINCDHESQYAFNLAGAEADRVHINQLIRMKQQGRPPLAAYHVIVVDGGFAWADDHGAGVLLALKMRSHLGDDIQAFLDQGKLIIGVCNGFQALVNMGLLPALDGDRQARTVALIPNDCGNFRDQWVNLAVNPASPCVFTKGIDTLDLPVRHGEGKFFAPPETIARLEESGQVVLRYTDQRYRPAQGRFPFNPNGSLNDIAGICDPAGLVFGLMPHPEAFHHLTNHPDWTRTVEKYRRLKTEPEDWSGDGLKIFKNAVEYVRENLL